MTVAATNVAAKVIMGKHRGRYVAYYRVSTSKQGASGLGLDAQARTVADRLNGGTWTLIASFTEVESGTRKAKARPQLEAALSYCRLMNARLIVANVSRLTRDAGFMGKLVEAGVAVEFCDLPNVDGPVGEFMLRQMMNVAQLEAGMIGERTKKALAAARERGVKLGGDRGNLREVAAKGHAASLAVRRAKAQLRARDLAPVIAEVRASGIESLCGIARALEERGIPTAWGGTWSAVQVKRVLERAG